MTKNLIDLVHQLDTAKLPNQENKVHRVNLRQQLMSSNYFINQQRGAELIVKKILFMGAALAIVVIAVFSFNTNNNTSETTNNGVLQPLQVSQVSARELAQLVLVEINGLSSEKREHLAQQVPVDTVELSLQKALKADDLKILTPEEFQAQDAQIKLEEETGDFSGKTMAVAIKDSKNTIVKYLAYTDQEANQEVIIGVDQDNLPLYWQTISK